MLMTRLVSSLPCFPPTPTPPPSRACEQCCESETCSSLLGPRPSHKTSKSPSTNLHAHAMSTLSMQAAPSLGHPMEKLLDNYMMAERGGGAGGEEGGGGAAFMLEDGGMISYTGVFMDDEEDSDDDASASSTEAEVMAHLHAALGGSVGSTNASGSTSSSSSSGSTSTSGGTVSAAPEGDNKGEGCK